MTSPAGRGPGNEVGSGTLDDPRRADLRTHPSRPARLYPPSQLFFAEDPAELEFAKTLCGTCAARAACLAGALARREPVGVWGGHIFDDGRVIERKRGRGRPPNPAGRARRNGAAGVRTAAGYDLGQVG